MRVALWTGGSFVALVLVVVAVVGWWAHNLVNEVGHLSKGVIDSQSGLSKQLPISNAPAVALVIGSDYRAGDVAGGSRSDTLMLVRIDPRTKYISLLSLPRDLHVTIPGYGVDKINAAYSDGGYKLALQTVEDATGVKPNYLVTVDFKGFRDLVDKFHGVYVPVDQRYYHVNVPGQEQYSQVDIPPGYQLLDGTNALAYARYRHTDSDFYRNARQQVFLHAFSQRASSQLHGIGLDQLTTLRDVAETVAKNVQVTGPNGPPSVQTMIELATTAYAIKDRVISSRLNAAVAGDATDSYVEATPQAMHAAVFAFMHPETMRPPTNTLPGKTTSGHKVPKFKPEVDPTTTPVTTVNGNGTTGAAAKGGAALGAWGYPVTVSQNHPPTFDFRQSVVYYRPGDQQAAGDVADILGGAVAQPITAAYKGYAARGLVVVLGKSFTGTLAHEPSKSTGGLPSDVTRDSTYRAYFRQADGPANFPVLYPNVRQDASTFVPWAYSPVRTYNIKEAGGGNNSLYAYWGYNGIAGAYWGIEETRFTKAPILANPDQKRKLDGRTYQFYFNGAHIHMVAFIDHGTAYWVQNTLRDDMSNADMIAVARSLKPVK
ncbi:MAG TPA: LCP family protein [Gaiellales bacterium]|nr:LCP family protein [Gaiellales bacterium]